MDAWADSLLGHAYGRAGNHAQAMAIARELENRIREGWSSAAELAIVYLGLGEDEEALEKLEAALAEPPFARNYYFSYLKVDPIWDPLRDDPRFQDLLRRMDFPE